MPNVVVYVPAAAWRGLEEAGREPKLVVRKLVAEHLFDPELMKSSAGEVVKAERFPEAAAPGQDVEGGRKRSRHCRLHRQRRPRASASAPTTTATRPQSRPRPSARRIERRGDDPIARCASPSDGTHIERRDGNSQLMRTVVVSQRRAEPGCYAPGAASRGRRKRVAPAVVMEWRRVAGASNPPSSKES